MKIGAVIVAAGMSERMRRFRELMEIGNLTMAERTVTSFQRAGADRIVMVTGYRSAYLKKNLSSLGIDFAENPDYETTEMFESVKIGLERLGDSCDKVLFCPVDIPFFSDDTVSRLLACPAEIAIPKIGGVSGHPVAIAGSLIPSILSYKGQGGLDGALRETGAKVHYIEVEDPGTLKDTDTREGYEQLVDRQNEQLLRPTVRLGIATARECFTEETANLIELVQSCHSVKEACKYAGISYSKGWELISTAEAGLGYSLIRRLPGGKYGGEASVTEKGQELLRAYRELQNELEQIVKEKYSQIFFKTAL